MDFGNVGSCLDPEGALPISILVVGQCSGNVGNSHWKFVGQCQKRRSGAHGFDSFCECFLGDVDDDSTQAEDGSLA